MGCRISHRQALPPERTAAESHDIDVRFIAEAVRAAVSRVIRQGVGATDRVALVPDLLTGSRSPRWAPRADRIGVGPAMYHFDQGLFGEIGLSTPGGSAKAAALQPISPLARPRGWRLR